MSQIILAEQTTPATPSSGNAVIYPKADGKFYELNDNGVETQLAWTKGATVTASGTAIDFSPPAGVTYMVFGVYSVSLSGSTGLFFRIGDSGGIKTTGYEGTSIQVWTTVSVSPETAYWRTYTAASAAVFSGEVSFSLVDAVNFRWECNGRMSNSAGQTFELFGGSAALTGELTTVRMGSVDGSSTFDSGFIRPLYWN